MKGVSVIICCYNSAARLPKTFEYLSLQNAPSIDWEVIVVDNCSTDFTFEVANICWNKLNVTIEFKVVKEIKPGLTNARLKGVSVSKYEYLVFCDDDNWLCEDYISNVYKIFERDQTIGVIGGQSLPVLEGTQPEWFKEFKKAFAIGTQSNHEGDITLGKGYVWGAGMAIRKSYINKIQSLGIIVSSSDRNGKTLTSGGDVEMCFLIKLLGGKIYYTTKVVLFHYIPNERLNPNYLRRIYSGIGISAIYLNPYIYYFNDKDYIKKKFLVFKEIVWLILNSFQGWINIFSLNKMSTRLNAVKNFYYLKELIFNYKNFNFQVSKIRHISSIIKYSK